MRIYSKVAVLGGRTASGGINWVWSYLPNEETAKKFIAFLNHHKVEHRGIYPPNEKGEYPIRWR